jgi:hypothetical protein
VSGLPGFDVHDTGNTTPRARIQVNTGGNSASAMFLSIEISFSGGQWSAIAEDPGLGRTFTGRSECTMGAVIALLADRLGLDAEVRMRP